MPNIIEKLKFALRSKEYKEGFAAAVAGVHSFPNPYNDKATDDNLRRGMGASPYWETRYAPFSRWQKGHSDGDRPRVERVLAEMHPEAWSDRS
jgi:hypothetical protein